MQVLKNKIQTIKKEYYELRMLLRTALLFLSDTPLFPSQRHDRPESATRARRVSDTGKRVPAHFFYSFINT